MEISDILTDMFRKQKAELETKLSQHYSMPVSIECSQGRFVALCGDEYLGEVKYTFDDSGEIEQNQVLCHLTFYPKLSHAH